MILTREQVAVLKGATEALFAGQKKIPGIVTAEDLCDSHEELRRELELAKGAVDLLVQLGGVLNKERDEARRMVCEDYAAGSEMEFRSCWGEDSPVEKVLKENPDVRRPRTPREVAEQKWPDQADRLFPPEVPR